MTVVGSHMIGTGVMRAWTDKQAVVTHIRVVGTHIKVVMSHKRTLACCDGGSDAH
jgi:hypothetical protein